MATVYSIDKLPKNWPAFVEDCSDELGRLFGPSYAQSYRATVTPTLATAVASGVVRAWCIGTSHDAFGMCTATMSGHVGRITWIHVLEPYRAGRWGTDLVEAAVSELKHIGMRYVLMEFVSLDNISWVHPLIQLGFAHTPRQLMVASAARGSAGDTFSLPDNQDISHAMADVLVAAYAHHPGRAIHPEVQSHPCARNFFRAVLAGGYGCTFPGHVQVARHEGVVAGFAAGAASGDDVAVLLHLAVAPASQGRGYGERLVRAFLHQAGEAGYAQTALVVDADNPARRLYTRIGFTPLRPVDAFHWCDMTGTP